MSTDRLVVLEHEGGMAEEADVHGSVSCGGSLVSMSSCASSRPTATPTSIPSRVSSASSVRSARHALVGVLAQSGLGELALVGLAEPAALGQRLGQHALEAGRGVRDDLLRVAEALGLAQSLHGRVDLLGGVPAPGHGGTLAKRARRRASTAIPGQGIEGEVDHAIRRKPTHTVGLRRMLRRAGHPGSPTHPCGGRRPRTPESAYLQPPRISTAMSETCVGVRPTRTPLDSSASALATAVPEVPETIAPAWPIVLPGGAVKPAM